MQNVIRYWLYPFLLLITLIGAALVLQEGADLRQAFGYFLLARLALLLFVEWRWPARKEWAMTWHSFLRDVKYMVVLGGGGYLVKYAIAWFSIDVATEANGAMTQQPVLLQLLLLALFYEFFQYWLHRISHEARGPIGRFLWRTHSLHHLPKRVYLLMHVVAHPVNFVLVMLINIGSIYLLGVGKEAVFLLNVLMGLQGLVSHFNAPISAGPFNYVLVGTELHRNHHSADLAQSGNYGVLTPIWDIVFGTFRYTPGREPLALGVSEPEHYPASNELIRCMLLPFRTEANPAPKAQEP